MNEREMFLGLKFVTDPRLVVRGPQYRFPRTKKKRILKKWQRVRANYRTLPNSNVFELPGSGVVIVHPSISDAIKRGISE